MHIDDQDTMSVDESVESQDTAQDTSNEQNAESSQESPRTPEQGQVQIPEKFKTVEDLAKAYTALESKFGEISSERATLKRDAEEKAQRLYELQNAIYQQTLARQPSEEVDPLANLEEEIQDNPAQALKKVAKTVKELTSRNKEETIQALRKQEAADFYERQKKENPDFSKREQEMAELAKRYSHLIKPEMWNSKDAIQVLDLMSRGQKVQDYVKDAEERVRKERDLIKNEKRKAFSESSNSQGEVSDASPIDSFHKLSMEEQEKELRKLEQQLGRSDKF